MGGVDTVPLEVEDYDSARRRGLDHDEAIMSVARRRDIGEDTLEDLVEMRDQALGVCPRGWT
jgi:hypothetical protein